MIPTTRLSEAQMYRCQNCGRRWTQAGYEALARDGAHTDANGVMGQANKGVAFCPHPGCADFTLVETDGPVPPRLTDQQESEWRFDVAHSPDGMLYRIGILLAEIEHLRSDLYTRTLQRDAFFNGREAMRVERDEALAAARIATKAAQTIVRTSDQTRVQMTQNAVAAAVAPKEAAIDSERDMNAILTEQLEQAEANQEALRVELTRLQSEADHWHAHYDSALLNWNEAITERDARLTRPESDRLIEQNHTLQRQLEEAQIAVRSWRDAALNGEAKARQVFETWRQSRPFQHGENRSVLGEWFSHGTGQAFLDALTSAFQGSAEPPTRKVEMVEEVANGERRFRDVTPAPPAPSEPATPSPLLTDLEQVFPTTGPDSKSETFGVTYEGNPLTLLRSWRICSHCGSEYDVTPAPAVPLSVRPTTTSGQCGCDGPTRIDPNCRWHYPFHPDRPKLVGDNVCESCDGRGHRPAIDENDIGVTVRCEDCNGSGLRPAPALSLPPGEPTPVAWVNGQPVSGGRTRAEMCDFDPCPFEESTAQLQDQLATLERDTLARARAAVQAVPSLPEDYGYRRAVLAALDSLAPPQGEQL